MKKLLFILIASVLVFSSCKKDIDGCTDSSATNYDATATNDDGTCMYPIPLDSTTNTTTSTTTNTSGNSTAGTTNNSTCSSMNLSYITDGTKFTYTSIGDPFLETYIQFNSDGTFYLFDELSHDYGNKPFKGTWKYNGCNIKAEIRNYPIAQANIVYFDYKVEIYESTKTVYFKWLTWQSNYSYEQEIIGTKQ